MQLSKRLQAVANFVTKGNTVADIGTDHGYIPIYLCEEGITPRAIAMDINQGPLKRAEENIQLHGLNNRITTRLSDGVTALSKEESDTVIIAGMGGGLVKKILSEGTEVLKSVKEFVLQPQSELKEVREFLRENHYCIIDEDMVLDGGKYYPIMKVVHGIMDELEPEEYKFGKFLIEKQHVVLRQFLLKEQRNHKKVREQLRSLNSQEGHILARIITIEEELKDIQTALNRIEASCFYHKAE